jgi:hypothetical protein
MAILPLSTNYVPGRFLVPDGRVSDDFTDYEMGPIAVQDPSEIWEMVYDPDTDDFILTDQDGAGTPQTVLNVADVTQIAFTFDQNGNLFITYVQLGQAYFYWWDPTAGPPAYVTVALEAGATSPRCGLDDKRPLELADSDIILTYILSGDLIARYERERYDTAHILDTDIGVGAISRFGMATSNRVQWIGGVNSVYLGDIVRQICWGLGVTDIDTNEIDPIKVRGFMTAGLYSGADALRALMRSYFFDMPEIDGEIYCKLRGGPIVATVYLDDMKEGKVDFESAREQEVEFPKKLHLKYRTDDTDWTPTTETSSRLSPDITVRSETSIETPVNFLPDDAAKTVYIMHKIAWNEFEGTARFTLSNQFIRLTPADPISVEIQKDQFKRMRVVETMTSGLEIKFLCVIDRVSSYDSDAASSAPVPVPPEPPPAQLPGATTWEFLDLPAQQSSHDTLHAYVTGYGETVAWRGAKIQRQIGADWIDEGDIISGSVMGVTTSTLAAHARGIDTTNDVLIQVDNGDIDTITQAEFDNGGNACVIGNEELQFRDVADAGGGLLRISYLNRGALNTKSPAHNPGERFVMLANAVRLFLGTSLIDATFNLRAVSYSTDPMDAVPVSVTFTGQSQTEWEPLDFTGVQNGDDWDFAWTPNPRIGAPFAPVQSVNFEGYRVKLSADAGAYNPNVQEFDGSTGSYTATGLTTTGNKITGVFRFSRDSFTGDTREFLCNVLETLPIRRARLAILAWSSDNTTNPNRVDRIQVSAVDTAGAFACNFITPVGLLDGNLHTGFFSYDGDAGTAILRIDGVDADDAGNPDRVAPQIATLASGTDGEAAVGSSITGSGPTEYFGGQIGYFGYRDAYLTNWSDFMDGVNPKPLDEATWTEWGAQPAFWKDTGAMDASIGSDGVMVAAGTITEVAGAFEVILDIQPGAMFQ